MQETLRYGKKYWLIMVPKSVSIDKEITLMADTVYVQGGALVFSQKDGDDYSVNLVMAPGQWIAAYAASMLDGHAVAVEHWREQVNRSDGG